MTDMTMIKEATILKRDSLGRVRVPHAKREEMLDAFERRAVPPKLAIPILEESSLEEDDSLNSLWNALLANALDPDFAEEIRFAYTDIIKNLSPLDSLLMSAIYDAVKVAGYLDFTKAPLA